MPNKELLAKDLIGVCKILAIPTGNLLTAHPKKSKSASSYRHGATTPPRTRTCTVVSISNAYHRSIWNKVANRTLTKRQTDALWWNKNLETLSNDTHTLIQQNETKTGRIIKGICNEERISWNLGIFQPWMAAFRNSFKKRTIETEAIHDYIESLVVVWHSSTVGMEKGSLNLYSESVWKRPIWLTSVLLKTMERQTDNHQREQSLKQKTSTLQPKCIWNGKVNSTISALHILREGYCFFVHF